MTRSRLAAVVLAAAITLVPTAGLAQGKTASKAATSAACESTDLVPTASNLSAIRDATFCLINVERTSRGRDALRTNRHLAQAASGYSRTMVDNGFFAHVAPNGSTMVGRIKQTAYLSHNAGWALGENLAWGQSELGSPREIVEAWMRSAGHKRNILDGKFDEIGIGVTYGTPVGGGDDVGATYTTEFGSRVYAAPTARTARTTRRR